MKGLRFGRSSSTISSSGESIDKVKNSDNSVKQGERTSSSRNDLWQKAHKELLGKQSLSPAKQAHSLTEQTQKVADNLAAPQEALHRPDEWKQKDLDAIDGIKEWHDIAECTNEIMEKELYNHLPKHIKSDYEKNVKDFYVVHGEYTNGHINKSDFESNIDRFKLINREMKEFVDPWEKLSSGEHLSDGEIGSIKEKIARTAERMGWKNFMEGATKFIQKANSDYCSYIIDAAGESGDRSIEKGLLELASNENNILSIRMHSVYALGKIGNASTIKALENMSQSKIYGSMHLSIRAARRAISNKLK